MFERESPAWLPPIPAEPAKPARRGMRRWLGPLAVLGAVLLKAKSLLLLLPKLKLLATAGTMVLSIAAYALVWGWTFAVGFVALLFVHEMGHYIQLRREGVKDASAPIFIPFLGALIWSKTLGDDAAAEARVGLAGPVLGTIGCLVPLALWRATGDDFWQAATFIGFFLNLFNLLPVLPLDGGRAMAAMAPWMWFAGFGAMVLLLFLWPNPILALIALLGALELYRRWKERKSGAEGNAAYYRVAPRHRLAVAAVYIGLIVALVVGMDLTFVDHSARL